MKFTYSSNYSFSYVSGIGYGTEILNQAVQNYFTPTSQPTGSLGFNFKNDQSWNYTNMYHECKDCGKRFTHPISLIQHRVVHKFRMKCPLCQVTTIFSRKYTLIRHLQTVHKQSLDEAKNEWRHIAKSSKPL